MQAQKPIFEEISRLASGAMGAAQAAGDELRDIARFQAERLASDMDLIGRDEFEILKLLVSSLSQRCEDLEARIVALEGNSATRTSDFPVDSGEGE